MRKIKDKSTFWFSGITIVAALVILIFLLRSFYYQYQKKIAIQREIANLKAEQDNFSKTTRELEENLRFLSSQSYKVKVARGLNMKVEGEEVVIFPEDFRVIKKELNPINNEKESNWTKWWRYFFGVQP